MKHQLANLLLALVLASQLIAFPRHVIADETEDKSYFEMSLEELINITVVTASSFDQKVSDASAIIDVYTAEQIRDLGVDNLYDFLSFLPGIEIIETYYGYTVVQFRGILQSHYTNKSSLLLNGQPLYDEIISSYYLEQIPMSVIDKVEVIRGPGSVLYGTNAFAGVINVITKDGKSMDGSALYLKGGSFNTGKVSFASGREIDGIDIFFGGEFNESDGYEKSVLWDEDDADSAAGTTGERPYGNRTLGFYPDDRKSYENDYANFFTSVGYRDVAVSAVYFESRKDKFGIIPTLVSTGERHVRGYSVNARYHRSLLDNKALVRGIVWHDWISKDERINSYPPAIRAAGAPHDQTYGGVKTGFQTQASYPVAEKLDLMGGFGYESSSSDPYLFLYTDSVSQAGEPIQNLAANAILEEKSTNDVWAFMQASWSPVENVDIQAGSRVNTNEQAGSVLIPSIGVVFHPTEKFVVKCLYGAGFRNPSFFEKYVQTVNVLAGDKDLKPERINTIEIGMDYSFSNYSLRINGFHTITDKLIMRRALIPEEIVELNARPGYGSGSMDWSKGFVYYNSKGEVYNGVEFSFQGRPTTRLTMQGNATYKIGEDEDGNELKYFAPFHANLAVRFSPMKSINSTLTLQYVAEREGNYAAKSPWQTWPDAASGGTDYTLDAYTLLNARIGVKPVDPIELSIIFKNILDTEYYYPEYIRRSIPSIPGGPGQSFFVEIGYWL